MTDRCEFAQVLTTAGSREEAGRIARALVEERLAACAQVVGPIQSTYRWEGAVEEAEEYLVLVKTLSALSQQVVAAIRRNHSYQTPEILCTPILDGDRDYLSWVRESVQG